LRAFFSPKNQVRLAWLNFWGSLVLAPVSVFTFARGEPPTVLLLSWWAITVTAMGFISAAQANKRIEIQAEEADVEVETADIEADVVEVNR